MHHHTTVVETDPDRSMLAVTDAWSNAARNFRPSFCTWEGDKPLGTVVV